MKIPGSQMLVNPVRTNETVSGAVNTPNFSQNLGIETKFAEMIEQNAYKYQELRDNEQILGSESFILEGTQDTQSFQLGLKTDDSYYKDSQKFTEFSDRFKNRKEMYLKMAKENGYKPEIIEAAISRMDREFEETKAIYGKYSLDYLKEKNRKADYLMADERAKTMSQIYLNGNYEKGNMQYKENGNALWKMYQKENLTPEQFTSRVNRSKQDAIASRVMALVNDPNGAVILNEWSKKNPQEFQELFKELQQKFGDYDVILDTDDFELFQRSINGAVNAIETKRKAQEEVTLYEATKQIQYRKKNNFAIESKNYSANIPPSQIGETLYVDTTNNYYGTTFKDWREPIQLGYQFKLLDDSNSQEKFYNDIGISGVELINKNVEEYQMYAGGKEEDFARATRDGMAIDYHSRGVKTAYGYNVNKQLQNAGSETSNLLVRTYTPESRQVLSKLDNVNLNFTGNFEKFKEYKATFKTGRPTSSMAPSIPYGATAQMNTKEPEWEVLIGEEFENNKYTDLSVIGTIEGLGYTASKGDVNAKATSQDLTNIASDVFKLMAIEKMSGILSEDIADDLKMKESAGMFITDLSLSEQKKVFNHILREDDKLKEEFVKVFEPVAKEILGDTQIGTLTNGRFVRLNGVTNVSKEVRGLDDYMENNDFIAIVGKNPDGTDKTKIVKGKELVPISTSDGKQILITYNGNPVILNNAVAVYEVGGIE